MNKGPGTKGTTGQVLPDCHSVCALPLSAFIAKQRLHSDDIHISTSIDTQTDACTDLVTIASADTAA